MLLRGRSYLLDRFLQFLHIDWFGQMRGKTGPAAALQVLLHHITADRYALGVANFGQFSHHLEAIAIRKTKIANEKIERSCAQYLQSLTHRGGSNDLVPVMP